MSSTPLEVHQHNMMEDVTGYAVSCSSQGALDWFNEGITAFVSLYGNSMALFSKALEMDPKFLLPHCVLVNIASYVATYIT